MVTPKPIFYSAVEMENRRHTGDCIVVEILKDMEKIGTEVSILNTGIASNMKAAWRIISLR